MANKTTNLTKLDQYQGAKEVTANGLFDAASQAMLFGRRQEACSGLSWAYYGGNMLVGTTITQIANGSVMLTGSATNYVESDTSGTVTANTTAFTSGRLPLYTVVTSSTVVTDWTDYRSFFMPSNQSLLSTANVAFNNLTLAGTLAVTGSATFTTIGASTLNGTLTLGSGASATQSGADFVWSVPSGKYLKLRASNNSTYLQIKYNDVAQLFSDYGVDIKGFGTGYGIRMLLSGTEKIGIDDEVIKFFGGGGAGGGNGVLSFPVSTTAPTSNPSSGFVIYVDPADNKLKARGQSGTFTTLANP